MVLLRRSWVIGVVILLQSSILCGQTGLLKMMKINNAAKKGRIERVRELLSAGVDPNVRAPAGETPIFFAAWGGHRDVVALLADAGASINHRADDGRTPLIVAATFGNLGAAEELLSRGASASWKTNDGWSALMRAREGGHSAVVERIQAHINEVLANSGQQKEESDLPGVRPPRSSSGDERAVTIGTPTPGMTLSLRQPCPGEVNAFLFAAGGTFHVDASLESTNALLDGPSFFQAINQVLESVKSTCQKWNMIGRVAVEFTAPGYRNNEEPAATALYLQGNAAQLEAGRSTYLEFRNFVLAEAVSQRLREKGKVELEPQAAEVVGNPFRFEGRVVALTLRLVSMETATMGRFATGVGEVLVSDIPEGFFNAANQSARVAGRVIGKVSVPGGVERLAGISFTDAYICLRPGCEELQDR